MSIDNTFETDIETNYNEATGHNTLSETINTNIKNTIISTLNGANDKTELLDVLNEFNLEYLEFKEDFPEAAQPVWELSIESEISYQSDNIISIPISIYEYKGGAHGNDQIRFLNLDAKTGNILALNDFIEINNSFIKLAKSYFIKNLNENDTNLKMEDYFFGKSFHLPENMGLCDEGLILLYNVYEVSSYAQGYTEFVIPFEKVESFLKRY